MPAFSIWIDFLNRCFATLCELAPWLLLGMLIAGVMHVLLPKNFVKRRFRGIAGVFQSVLLGVPLPLCSCGVVPAGIGLKNDGASDGASLGFLISTPQTGVDSFLVSASFFGWPFAIFKMLSAAILGIAGGCLTEIISSDDPELPPTETSLETIEDSTPWPRRLCSHAMEVLESIWLWLLIGVVVSALIGMLGFESLFESLGEDNRLLSMLLMLAISIPLYVCATASVPIAASLVASGLPPSVALVFLMAGPATNLTTMGAIRKRFGWRVLSIYLATLVIGSFLAAFLFESLLGGTNAHGHGAHAHDHRSWWSLLSAVILMLLIGLILARKWFRRENHVANDSTIELSLEGLHCQNCVSRVETAIGQLEEVDSVHVNLNRASASINGRASIERLRSVIEGLGFRVNNPEETT